MILFLEDWNKYPSAVVHTTTANTSWLRLAYVYKQMGIKNHVFHLALHNPNLANIDPWSSDLTQDEIIMIVAECKENPWYFFREVVRIPARGAGDGVPLRANRANISAWWLFFNHITTLLLQPRQTGKTLTETSLTGYIIDIAAVNTDVFVLTKDDALRMKTVQDVKDFLENLPWYLYLKKRSDVYNTEQITIKDLGNVLRTAVAQSSHKAANNVGRGFTIGICMIDEFAFIKNIDITLPVLLATGTQARQIARDNGNPYGTIFTTTAGYLSSPEGSYAYKVYNDCLPWNEHLLDCQNEDELSDTIKRNSPSGKSYVLCEFSHRQLGYTDEWLRETINNVMADDTKIETEFLNKWQEGNASSPIPKDLLRVINNSVIHEPKTTITTSGYIIRWYVPEHEIRNKLKDRYIIMGCDTSDGIGNDDIAMCMRDVSTGEVLAVGVYNETNLIVFANWLVDMLVEYPNITLIIERKSSGVSIIDNLLLLLPAKNIDPFKRIFNWVTNDANINQEYKRIIQTPVNARDPSIYVKYKKEFGYATSAVGRSSRDNLYGISFNTSVKYTASCVRDKTLIRQLNDLVRKNDRIDHQEGGHDDLVIAWMLPLWMLLQGKNLAHYGIPQRLVLLTVNETMIEEEGGEEVMLEREYQMNLSKEINALVEQLKQENNPFKYEILLTKIKRLSKDLNDDMKNKFNIESFLESLRKDKIKNARRNLILI